eukprot:6758877-Pyramimonas_sp.AAC.1
MEGGSCSTCGSRLSAAHIVCNLTKDSRIEGESFSTCGSRLSATHIRFEHVQEFHGVRASGIQHVVLTSAPRTFVSTMLCRLRAGRFQNVVLTFAPRTFVYTLARAVSYTHLRAHETGAYL